MRACLEGRGRGMRHVIQVVAVIAGGILTAYLLGKTGSTSGWIWAVLFGVLYPAVGIHQWSTTRRRGPEFVGDAERMLGLLLAGQIGIVGIASALDRAHADCLEVDEARP